MVAPVDTAEKPKEQRGFDVFYIVLFISVLSVSAAGAALKKLDDTPPLLKAFWRVFVHSLVLVVPAYIQWRSHRSDAAFVTRLFLRKTLGTALMGGTALASHFGFWIWSLDHTSLAHSLLLVTLHPIIVVVFMGLTGTRPSALELGGVVLGLCGTTAVVMDVDSGTEVTLLGDAAALVGACCFVVYIVSCKQLRSWMPLFLFACPVTFISAVFLFFGSLALEWNDIQLGGLEPFSLFGFLAPSALLLVAFVVLVPGVLGHTGINAVLRRIPPLPVSVCITMEPVFGTLIGMAVGEEDAPGLWTLLGGPVNIVGSVLAVYGTSVREAREKKRLEVEATEVEEEDEASVEVQTVQTEGSGVDVKAESIELKAALHNSQS